MILFFISFLLLNFILVFFHKHISNLINIYDLPSENKIHKEKISCTGGIYILLNICLFLILLPLLNNNTLILSLDIRQLMSLLFTILSLLIIGILDDKYKLSPNIKSVLFFLVFFIFITFDSKSIISVLNLSFTTYSPHLNHSQAIIFTLFCYFSFLNAFNMFDGINFQSIFYSIIFFLFFLIKLNYDIFTIAILFSLLSILFLNLKNKIFLGNNGSNIISFLISYLIVNLYNTDKVFADDIILLMLIPGIDMTRMMFERIAVGRNPFIGDLFHIHHVLNKKLNLLKTQILIFFPILICFLSVLYFRINSVFLIIMTLIYYFFVLKFFKKAF